MEKISSSFFGRFIGVPTEIKLDVSGIVIEVESRLIKLKWEEIIGPPLFHLSFFGQIITFKTAGRNYVFTMLTYRSKHQKRNVCEQLWASTNLSRVDTLLASITKMTTNRYLRQSTVERIQIAVTQELSRWFPWLTQNRIRKLSQTNIVWQNIFDKLQQLSGYQQWQVQSISNYRESFIQKQLQTHKHYFDQVEANPLTPSQRRACIIDNDNNLLLAGAGTGKTSVMVGRAGYLLNSLQAKPNEILLLAYSRKAADEMDERIQDKLSTDKISASTFHRLGLNIITQVEGIRPNISIFAEDEKSKEHWVQTTFEQLIHDNVNYRELALEYFNKYYYEERSPFDFNTLGDSYLYFNDNDIRTFKGESVNSFGELYIANHLFSHGIEYQYKAKYICDVKTSQRKSYQPNFFLPELTVYIEYYGHDNNGETPDYIDKNAYYADIESTRTIHHKFKTVCLEFTYAQHKEGKLLNHLTQSLTACQIECGLLPTKRLPLERLPTELILATLKESGSVTALAKIVAQLMGLYKAACLENTRAINGKPISHDSVIANMTDSKQSQKAFALMKPLLSTYQHYLTSHAEIDFEDMISKALRYIKSGQFKSPWRYIMVDEFQDISEPRARLIKALRDNTQYASIFAVGDDWQAIYRFTGADITLTTQFDQYFGATTQSTLDQTFRFNNHIGKVATDFISKNPAQIHKTIKSLKQVNSPAVSLLKRDKSQVSPSQAPLIAEMASGAIDEVLTAISTKVTKTTTVYLLARFWFLLPNTQALNRLKNQYPLLMIENHSFHASKGKEADYVIIMGLNKGVNGFPSEKVTPEIFDALLPKKEIFDHAEERRLFYVGLTRAKDRVYIIADMTESNDFVNELVNEHQIELNEFSSTISQLVANQLNCLTCKTGILKKRIGRFGAFYACSNFPRCDHKEKPCRQCESPMTRTRYPGFKVCLNEACHHTIPTCKKCQAEMVLRTSKNGDFWGCRNYKGNDLMSCKYSVDDSKIHWPDTDT